MSTEHTREPQYDVVHGPVAANRGLTRLGLMTNYVWHDDPRRLGFLLARYKFVSKMLGGKRSALEVGCGDAFGTRIVLQEVPEVCAVDFDPVFIKDITERMEEKWKFECLLHDMLSGPLPRKFEAAYSLDVLEHIPAEKEDIFIGNIARSLEPAGVLIVGSPSLHSQAYASPPSKEGHINCKDHPQLKALLLRHFANAFVFSMNDEVVHTGFYPMAHYLLGMGVGVLPGAR